MVGYLLTFVVCWAVSSLILTACDGDSFFCLVAPVAPLYYSVLLVGGPSPGVGLFCLVVTTVALVFLVRGIFFAGHPAMIFVSHACIVVYWMWTFGLCRQVIHG